MNAEQLFMIVSMAIQGLVGAMIAGVLISLRRSRRLP